MATVESYSVAARKLLRDTVLDATAAELDERVWPEVTMAEIARRAGVSRQTLYNEFGSRDELAQAFVLREEERLIEAVESTIRANAGRPAAALESAFAAFLVAAAGNPLIRRVFDEADADHMLPLVTTQGRPVVEGAAARLTEIILSCWPEVSRGDAELVAESMVRLAISYAALPGGMPSETARGVVRLLEPFIDKAFAGPQ